MPFRFIFPIWIHASAWATLLAFAPISVGWAGDMSQPAILLRSKTAPPLESQRANWKDLAAVSSDITIPSHLGLVKAKFHGKKDRVVVHIQDAHASEEAQRNIAGILDYLVVRHDLKTVGLEGAEGPLRTEIFSFFPDQDVRRDVSDYFLKEGRLTGAEYLAIVSRPGLRLYGMEQEALYDQNLAAYKESLELREKIRPVLALLEKIFSEMAHFVLDAELQELIWRLARQEENTQGFVSYLDFLIRLSHGHRVPLAGYPGLRAFLEMSRLQASVDFEKIPSQVHHLAGQLGNSNSKNVRGRYRAAALRFRSREISRLDFYEFLLQEIRRDGRIGDENLIRYLEYIRLYDRMGASFFEEVEALESALQEKLCKSKEERQFLAMFRTFGIYRKLFSLSLTKPEAEFFFRHREDFRSARFRDFLEPLLDRHHFSSPVMSENLSGLDAAIPVFEKFYDVALERDRALLENTVHQLEKSGDKMIVLVSGGFHSPGIERSLREKGYSYFVVTPRLTAVKKPEDQERLYRDALLRKPLDFEKWFSKDIFTQPHNSSPATKFQLVAKLLTPAGERGVLAMNDPRQSLAASFWGWLIYGTFFQHRGRGAFPVIRKAMPAELSSSEIKFLMEMISTSGEVAYRQTEKPLVQTIYRHEPGTASAYHIYESVFDGRHSRLRRTLPRGVPVRRFSIGKRLITFVRSVDRHLVPEDVQIELAALSRAENRSPSEPENILTEMEQELSKNVDGFELPPDKSLPLSLKTSHALHRNLLKGVERRIDGLQVFELPTFNFNRFVREVYWDPVREQIQALPNPEDRSFMAQFLIKTALPEFSKLREGVLRRQLGRVEMRQGKGQVKRRKEFSRFDTKEAKVEFGFSRDFLVLDPSTAQPRHIQDSKQFKIYFQNFLTRLPKREEAFIRLVQGRPLREILNQDSHLEIRIRKRKDEIDDEPTPLNFQNFEIVISQSGKKRILVEGDIVWNENFWRKREKKAKKISAPIEVSAKSDRTDQAPAAPPRTVQYHFETQPELRNFLIQTLKPEAISWIPEGTYVDDSFRGKVDLARLNSLTHYPGTWAFYDLVADLQLARQLGFWDIKDPHFKDNNFPATSFYQWMAAAGIPQKLKWRTPKFPAAKFFKILKLIRENPNDYQGEEGLLKIAKSVPFSAVSTRTFFSTFPWQDGKTLPEFLHWPAFKFGQRLHLTGASERPRNEIRAIKDFFWNLIRRVKKVIPALAFTAVLLNALIFSPMAVAAQTVQEIQKTLHRRRQAVVIPFQNEQGQKGISVHGALEGRIRLSEKLRQTRENDHAEVLVRAGELIATVENTDLQNQLDALNQNLFEVVFNWGKLTGEAIPELMSEEEIKAIKEYHRMKMKLHGEKKWKQTLQTFQNHNPQYEVPHELKMYPLLIQRLYLRHRLETLAPLKSPVDGLVQIETMIDEGQVRSGQSLMRIIPLQFFSVQMRVPQWEFNPHIRFFLRAGKNNVREAKVTALEWEIDPQSQLEMIVRADLFTETALNGLPLKVEFKIEDRKEPLPGPDFSSQVVSHGRVSRPLPVPIVAPELAGVFSAAATEGQPVTAGETFGAIAQDPLWTKALPVLEKFEKKADRYSEIRRYLIERKVIAENLGPKDWVVIFQEIKAEIGRFKAQQSPAMTESRVSQAGLASRTLAYRNQAVQPGTPIAETLPYFAKIQSVRMGASVNIQRQDRVKVRTPFGDAFVAIVEKTEPEISEPGKNWAPYQQLTLLVQHDPGTLLADGMPVEVMVPLDKETRRAWRNKPSGPLGNLPDSAVFARRFVPSSLPPLVELAMLTSPDHLNTLTELILRHDVIHDRLEALNYLAKNHRPHFENVAGRLLLEGDQEIAQATLEQIRSKEGSILDLLAIFDKVFEEKGVEDPLTQLSYAFLKEMLETSEEAVEVVVTEARANPDFRKKAERFFIDLIASEDINNPAVLAVLRSPFWMNQELGGFQAAPEEIRGPLIDELGRRVALSKEGNSPLAFGGRFATQGFGNVTAEDLWVEGLTYQENARRSAEMLRNSPHWRGWRFYVSLETRQKVEADIQSLLANSQPAAAAEKPARDFSPLRSAVLRYPGFEAVDTVGQSAQIQNLAAQGKFRDLVRLLRVSEYRAVHGATIKDFLIPRPDVEKPNENQDARGRLYLAQAYVDSEDEDFLKFVENTKFFTYLASDVVQFQRKPTEIFPQASARAVYQDALVKLHSRWDQLASQPFPEDWTLRLIVSLPPFDYEVHPLISGNPEDERWVEILRFFSPSLRRAVAKDEQVRRGAEFVWLRLYRETYALRESIKHVPGSEETLLQNLEQLLDPRVFNSERAYELLTAEHVRSEDPVFRDFLVRYFPERVAHLGTGERNELHVSQMLRRWGIYAAIALGSIFGLVALTYILKRFLRPWLLYRRALSDDWENPTIKRVEMREIEMPNQALNQEADHWDELIHKSGALSQQDYSRILHYARRILTDKDMRYDFRGLENVFAQRNQEREIWDVDGQMSHLMSYTELLRLSVSRLFHEAEDVRRSPSANGDREFAVLEIMETISKLREMANYSESLRCALGMVQALKIIERRQITKLVIKNPSVFGWVRIVINRIARVVYFITIKTFLFYWPAALWGKYRFKKHLKRALAQANQAMPVLYPETILSETKSILKYAFVLESRPNVNISMRAKDENRQYGTRILMIGAFWTALILIAIRAWFDMRWFINPWGVFSIGTALGAIGYSWHLSVMWGWDVPKHWDYRAIFKAYAKREARVQRWVRKNLGRDLPTGGALELERSLQAGLDELDLSKKRSLDVVLISYTSDAPDPAREAIFRKKFEKDLRADVHLVFSHHTAESITGGVMAFLEGRETLKQRYPVMRRQDPELPEDWREANVVHLFMGGGVHSDTLSFLQGGDFREIGLEAQDRPLDTDRLALLNAYKLARHRKKANQNGGIMILIPADNAYAGPLFTQGDITLIGAFVSLQEAERQDLGLFFPPYATTLTSFFEDPSSDFLLDHLHEKKYDAYLDPRNVSLKQFNGSTGIIVFSFENHAPDPESPVHQKRKIWQQFLDKLYVQLKKDQMLRNGSSERLVLDLSVALIPMVTREEHLFAYFEALLKQGVISEALFRFYTRNDILKLYREYSALQFSGDIYAGDASQSTFIDLRKSPVYQESVQEEDGRVHELLSQYPPEAHRPIPVQWDGRGNAYYRFSPSNDFKQLGANLFFAHVPLKTPSGPKKEVLLAVDQNDHSFAENELFRNAGESLVSWFVYKTAAGEKKPVFDSGKRDIRELPLFPPVNLGAAGLAWVGDAVLHNGEILLPGDETTLRAMSYVSLNEIAASIDRTALAEERQIPQAISSNGHPSSGARVPAPAPQIKMVVHEDPVPSQPVSVALQSPLIKILTGILLVPPAAVLALAATKGMAYLLQTSAPAAAGVLIFAGFVIWMIDAMMWGTVRKTEPTGEIRTELRASDLSRKLLAGFESADGLRLGLVTGSPVALRAEKAVEAEWAAAIQRMVPNMVASDASKGGYVFRYDLSLHSLAFLKRLRAELPLNVPLFVVTQNRAEIQSVFAGEISKGRIKIIEKNFRRHSFDAVLAGIRSELRVDKENILNLTRDPLSAAFIKKYQEPFYLGGAPLAARYLVVAGFDHPLPGAREIRFFEVFEALQYIHQSA